MVQRERDFEQWVRQARKRLNRPQVPFAPINWTNEARARVAFSILRDRAVTAVPELQGRVSHTNRDVRRFSVQMLGAIGPAIGEEAFKRMTNCLSDPDQEVRNDVIWALQFHRPEEYPAEKLIPIYLAGLRDSYHTARENAFIGLKRLGTNALPFKQAIEAARKQGDPIF
jgi:HEAT repeat protein